MIYRFVSTECSDPNLNYWDQGDALTEEPLVRVPVGL